MGEYSSTPGIVLGRIAPMCGMLPGGEGWHNLWSPTTDELDCSNPPPRPPHLPAQHTETHHFMCVTHIVKNYPPLTKFVSEYISELCVHGYGKLVLVCVLFVESVSQPIS